MNGTYLKMLNYLLPIISKHQTLEKREFSQPIDTRKRAFAVLVISKFASLKLCRFCEETVLFS